MRRVFADHALLPGGWAANVRFTLDEAGTIAALEVGAARDEAEHLPGWLLPGLPNLHSHAFQRALAGRTEHTAAGQSDSFWTWRAEMYALAERLDPEAIEAIAAQLYLEMLEGGFTAVGEFHYLHHAAAGRPYADPRELGLRILAAAEETGIALTHLPVLYQRGGFGQPPQERQRRFLSPTLGAYLQSWEGLAPLFPRTGRHRLGVAPHSLRAVDVRVVGELVQAARGLDPALVVHVHVAEQEAEVNECLAATGRRPLQLLLDEVGIDAAWCLVHATHLDPAERQALARSGAVAGLCPSTEADLGDGLFPAVEYAAEGGRFGVGSDSHVRVSASEELRLLEWGQRLARRRRNLILRPGGPGRRALGRELYQSAALGGAQALGQPVGALEVGRRADLVLLSAAHPLLLGHGPETVLDAFVFGGADAAVDQVWVAGRCLVRQGRHEARGPVAERFLRTLRRLGLCSVVG